MKHLKVILSLGIFVIGMAFSTPSTAQVAVIISTPVAAVQVKKPRKVKRKAVVARKAKYVKKRRVKRRRAKRRVVRR